MTAAHYAAALAIKSRVPNAPTAALVVGAFLPDFIWIVLSTAGIEPAQRAVFFDDWSHSLASILLWATLFALFFRSNGRAVVLAMWSAVFSHFLLDMPIHPKDLALYPHSARHIGLGLSGVPSIVYWQVQLGVVLALLGFYVFTTRRLRLPMAPVLASCALVLGWHVALMPD
jgi:hypothetical protein